MLKNRNRLTIGVIIFAIVLLVAYTQLSIFVIPPIGAIPDGRTLVILRLNKGHFIDSADAMCERLQGGVNLLCRGLLLGGVAKKSTVLMKLPYSKTLYLISTNGVTYNN